MKEVVLLAWGVGIGATTVAAYTVPANRTEADALARDLAREQTHRAGLQLTADQADRRARDAAVELDRARRELVRMRDAGQGVSEFATGAEVDPADLIPAQKLFIPPARK